MFYPQLVQELVKHPLKLLALVSTDKFWAPILTCNGRHKLCCQSGGLSVFYWGCFNVFAETVHRNYTDYMVTGIRGQIYKQVNIPTGQR